MKVPEAPNSPTPAPADAVEPVAPPRHEGDSDADPYSQFAVFDETELVYDSSAVATDVQTPRLSRQVSIPRYVLLTQGVLLGVVALAAFALGMVTGGSLRSGQASLPHESCRVEGTVSYAAGNRTLPDAGAVVIFFPQTKDPGRRISAAGLRSAEPLLNVPLAGAEEVRNMGGAYTLTDERGNYDVQLVDPGNYYVLVLSAHARRVAGQSIDTQDLAKINRFVENAADLLADSRYRFSTETVRGDRKLSALFD